MQAELLAEAVNTSAARAQGFDALAFRMIANGAPQWRLRSIARNYMAQIASTLVIGANATSFCVLYHNVV